MNLDTLVWHEKTPFALSASKGERGFLMPTHRVTRRNRSCFDPSAKLRAGEAQHERFLRVIQLRNLG